MTRHWGRVPLNSVHGIYYPVTAWLIRLRAYATPSVPVPPITILKDMVTRCRLLLFFSFFLLCVFFCAAHGARSCLSVRTQRSRLLVHLDSLLPHRINPCPNLARSYCSLAGTVGCLLRSGGGALCPVVELSWPRRVTVFQPQECMSATKPGLFRTFSHAPN